MYVCMCACVQVTCLEAIFQKLLSKFQCEIYISLTTSTVVREDDFSRIEVSPSQRDVACAVSIVQHHRGTGDI